MYPPPCLVGHSSGHSHHSFPFSPSLIRSLTSLIPFLPITHQVTHSTHFLPPSLIRSLMHPFSPPLTHRVTHYLPHSSGHSLSLPPPPASPTHRAPSGAGRHDEPVCQDDEQQPGPCPCPRPGPGSLPRPLRKGPRPLLTGLRPLRTGLHHYPQLRALRIRGASHSQQTVGLCWQ